MNLINMDENSVELLKEQVDDKFDTLFNSNVINLIDKIIEEENEDGILDILTERNSSLIHDIDYTDSKKPKNMVSKNENKKKILVKSFVGDDEISRLLSENKKRKQNEWTS